MNLGRIKNKSNFIVPIIFLTAFVLRLIFVFKVPTEPICPGSDQGLYLNSTKELYNIFSNLKIVKQELFRGTLAKGQGTLESYGIRFPITVIRTGFIQPLLYALVFLVFGKDNFFAISLMQAILGSLSCLLVFFISASIFNKKVSFLAALLSAINPLLINSTNTLLQETIITFFLLLTVLFFIKAHQNKSIGYFFLANINLFILTAGRLAFMYLFVLLLPLSFYFILKEKRLILWRKAVLGLVIGFLIPLFLWLKFVSIDSHRFGTILYNFSGPLSLIKCNLALNIEDTLGWFYFTDEDRSKIGPHLTKWLRQEGFSWNDKDDKNPPNDVCYRAFLKGVNRDKFGFLTLYLSKIVSQWWCVQSTFISDIAHRFFALILPLGIILTFFIQRLSLFLSIPVIYLTFLNSFIVVDYRYNLPLLPLVFIHCGFTFYFLWESFMNLDKKKKTATSLIFALAIFFYILSALLKVQILLLAFKQMKPFSAFLVNLGLKNIFIGLSIFSIYLVSIKSLAVKRKVLLILFLMLYTGLFNSWVYTNGIRFNRSWRQWSVELKDDGQHILQDIVFGKENLIGAKLALLKIDMQQIKGPIGVLSVLVNGKVVKEYKGKLTVGGRGYNYFFYEYIIDDPAKMRRWFSIPLDLSLLNLSDNCRIEIIHRNLQRTNAKIVIYGDYPVKDSDKFFNGPLFARNDFETSMYNLSLIGDYRVSGKVRLASSRTTSSFFDNSRWNLEDISNSPGIQIGYYRIRIEIIDKNGRSKIF